MQVKYLPSHVSVEYVFLQLEIIQVYSLLFLVERHRKEKINTGINRIGNLLPCSQALKQVMDKLTLFLLLSNMLCS